MHDFLIKEISNTNIEKELENIGFDKTYTHFAKDKFVYKNFKIYDLTPAQANILKQTAISVGADCGTHREVITGKIEKSNCVLGGSISQIIKISKKLQAQPFGLKDLGKLLEEKVNTQPSQTKIMGILNVTTNSFSDGGEYYKFEDSIKHLNQLIEEGADIIDIGAESTKPYSDAVSAENQLEKIEPILKYIKENSDIKTKSGFMIGLGETIDQIGETITDLYNINCDILTIGQYIQPSKEHLPVAKYYKPEEYENLKELAKTIGIKHFQIGPLVRSSYNAASLV